MLEKLESNGNLTGSLNFVNNWTYFTDPSNPDFEDLTLTGPYAGSVEARMTGSKLRERYNHLVPTGNPMVFWTCSSERDVATANYWADGFFGEDWEDNGKALLRVIPEIAELGGDTLTPGDTCKAYIEDKDTGHDYGYYKLAKWQDVFSKPIAERLRSDVNGVVLSPLEVYGMMEMCGFEILARGTSPWCEVFSHEEWQDFEYARDLLHFYRAGPGNKYANAMGSLWLNATTEIMTKQQQPGLYVSFVHDGDIVPMLASLGIYSGDRCDEEDSRSEQPCLPAHERKDNRMWTTSEIVPMGGRIIFERIRCDRAQPTCNGEPGQDLVRLSINDGIVKLPWCGSEPGGGQWTLDQFQQLVRERGQVAGSFADVCQLDQEAPQRITFLHQ